MKNMNTWKKSNKNTTITNVMTGTYIRVMIISMILGIVIFIGVSKKELEYRQSLNNQRVLNIVTYIIDSKLDNIRQFSDELIIDDELHDIFTRNQEIRNNLLGGLLIRRMAQQEMISSVHIIHGNDIVSELKYPVYEYDKRELINNLQLGKNHDLRGDFYWEIGNDNLESDTNTFYLVSNIKSKARMEHIGYLVIFMDISNLQREVKQFLDEEIKVIIKGGSEMIITFPENLTDDSIEKALKILEDNKGGHGDVSRRYSADALDSVEGEILLYSNQSIYTTNVEFAIVFMLIVIIGFTIIASSILERRVIAPLETIAERAREIGIKGSLDIEFPKEKHYSEVDDISNALNEMMTQIRALMVDVENREKLQRELELSVINHQIKPHFLYNTLNAASILVSVEEKESAKQLLTTLASYYRACLNHGNDIISLEGELSIVRDYIQIALIRNPNIVKVTYDIDDSLLSLQLPKMTIQTLVENSIKYGIKEMGQPVNILITVRRQEDYAEIIVEDDGVGMDHDIIDRVMTGKKLDAKSGFGLKSVLNRLALLYEVKNMNQIMKIESKHNSYTRIILKIRDI